MNNAFLFALYEEMPRWLILWEVFVIETIIIKKNYLWKTTTCETETKTNLIEMVECLNACVTKKSAVWPLERKWDWARERGFNYKTTACECLLKSIQMK